MKRLSEIEIARQFSTLPREQLELLLSLREELLKIIPRCNEYIKWNSLSYQKENLDAAIKGGICQLSPGRSDIELAFIHGAFLADPDKILKGNRKAKRFVVLHDLKDLKKPALINLIKASEAFDPYHPDGK